MVWKLISFLVNIDKLVNSFLSIFAVTPFMGVWIEIYPLVLLRRKKWVTPFMGVWIEILVTIINFWYILSHSLYGSVDWNSLKMTSGWGTKVTPFMGVWIEILVRPPVNTLIIVTPFMGVWIEIPYQIYNTRTKWCHSLYGSVDWN